jgi:hypothetical protein
MEFVSFNDAVSCLYGVRLVRSPQNFAWTGDVGSGIYTSKSALGRGWSAPSSVRFSPGTYGTRGWASLGARLDSTAPPPDIYRRTLPPQVVAIPPILSWSPESTDRKIRGVISQRT